MFPYWLLYSMVAAGALASPERRDRRASAGAIFVLVGLFLVLFIGLRSHVGTDWGAYARMFEQFRYADVSAIFSVAESEPAYGFVNWLAHQFSLGIWAVNIVCAAIFVYGLLRLARRQPRPWLALLVSVPFLVIVVGIGYTRQSAALGLIMLAFAALEEKRPSKAILLILGAAAFHTSALIVLPIIAFSYARNRLETGALVIFVAVIGYYTLLAPRIDRYSYGYIDQKYEAEGALVRLTMNLIPAVILLLAGRKFQLEPVQKSLWRNIAIVSVGSFVLLFVLGSSVALDRLALYLIPIQLFVFSRLPGAFAKSDTSQLTLTLLVMFYTAAVQFTWLNYANHAEYWLPYDTVLSPDEG